MIDAPSGVASDGSRRRGRVALLVFCIYIGAALPLILFHLGRYHWFFGDEWSFLAERDAGDLDDLFRSHGEHWVTIPVLVYRVLFNLFGLHSYVPYQAVVVVAHLTTALLLRIVMRRAGVRPWTATIAASVFVLFGPGEENIVWAFQFTFVGAVAFGLVHLILTDHEGELDRQDWLGLVAGAASLMCSGVSLVMVVVVGLFAAATRGWKVAAFHTIPLGALYGIWFLLSDPGGIDNPYGRGATVREVARFSWSGVRGAFEAIGAYWPIAILLAALLVIGFPFACKQLGRTAWRRAAAPVALLAGGLLFLIGTGYTRWFVTPIADSQSRYLYTLAVFLLPALAVGADAIARRWPLSTPIVLGLFLVGIVANIDDFGARVPFNEQYHRQQKELVVAIAHSEEAARVPRYVRPNPWFTIGWLRDTVAQDDLPTSSVVSRETARQIPLLVGVTQIEGRAPTVDCETDGQGVTLEPGKGDRYAFGFASKPTVGANWFAQNLLVVTQLGPDDKPVSSIGLKADFGDVLEIEADGLTLRFRAADPRQGLTLCALTDTG